MRSSSMMCGAVSVLTLVIGASVAMAENLVELETTEAKDAFLVEAGSDGQSRDILSCPFDELSAAYTSIYTDVQQINAAALYNEVLNICVNIQGQVKLILSNEQAVRGQLKDLLEPAPVARIEPDQPERSVPHVTAPVAPPEPVTNPMDLKTAKAEELENARRVDGKTDALVCAAPFQIIAILGSPVMGPGLNAVVVNVATGEERTVREGHTLPGGVLVDEITRDGVMAVACGAREPLLKHPGVPAVSDGGSLIPEKATVEDLYDAEIIAQ
ncbi:hypothetical protein [uncultured Ruegeria sp.]|uniref:hypothetical protein n=1 Tax=uncultured Ruegeria sp. TaxID=259304 RepID=UPI00262B3FD4|nr:hypothetical protein [uncultured Ruegeria sp.]